MPAILQQNYATEKLNPFNGLASLQISCRPCENSTRCDKTVIFEACRRADIRKTLKFLVRGALRPNRSKFLHSLLDFCMHGRASGYWGTPVAPAARSARRLMTQAV